MGDLAKRLTAPNSALFLLRASRVARQHPNRNSQLENYKWLMLYNAVMTACWDRFLWDKWAVAVERIG